MTDTRTPDQRRRIMKSVGTKNTGPELVVRRLLHGMGFRYRLHPRELPGKPDVVFKSRRKAIFVHGCYWHGHDCPKGRLPKSKLDYWGPKIEANKERDRRKEAELVERGFEVMTVWQCQTKDRVPLAKRLDEFVAGENSDRHSRISQLHSRSRTDSGETE